MVTIEIVENANEDHDPIEHGELPFRAVPRVGETIYLRRPDIILKVVEVSHSPEETHEDDRRWPAVVTVYCEPAPE